MFDATFRILFIIASLLLCLFFKKFMFFHWSVSKWNIESSAKYPTINYTGFRCNNMAIFRLAKRFVLKIKQCKNLSAICPFDILLITLRIRTLLETNYKKQNLAKICFLVNIFLNIWLQLVGDLK